MKIDDRDAVAANMFFKGYEKNKMSVGSNDEMILKKRLLHSVLLLYIN